MNRKEVQQMARPAMSAAVTAKHMTKAELEIKSGAETKLKGNSDKLKAPGYLTAAQKKIFNSIVRELEASGILGNLDVYVLSECCTAIDRIRDVERQINEEPAKLTNSALMTVKERYSKIFFRCCNELCLSPQSRAKIGNISLKAETENPLLKALEDD